MNKLQAFPIRLVSLISLFLPFLMTGALFFSAFSLGTILGNMPSWSTELG